MNCIIRFFANQPHRTPEGVALWTRAGGDWANTALALKQLAPYRERFAFIWDAERVAKVRPTVFDDHQAGLSVPVRRTKPLRKIWRRRDFQARGWARHNTIIVDDTPENFMKNFGNGIPIPAYNAWDASDAWLPRLRSFISSWPDDTSDLRPIEKRFWTLEGKQEGWWGAGTAVDEREAGACGPPGHDA
mmetsp:Transcript_45378/g.125034  ORF Transcript_45378/g.125034 Transcript_45378/m.125034 type:complete len:189 (+) Transcript_45378:879-1445(+)